MKKRIYISLLLLLGCTLNAFAQRPSFSIATDLGLQRSFKKEQQYWAVGQTVQTHLHFTPKDGAYVWISYYSNGKFKNDIDATAKSIATSPQQVNYVNNAEMRFKHFSVGWKHYLKGSSNAEEGWNLYGYAGFGLMLGRVINTHSVSIDTTLYNVPVRSGKANFKRLTLDLGLGWEAPLGGDVFFYTEGRLWVPTTDYPSRYIFVNKNAPFVASINLGIRILFD
ncbi:MAG: hypothetical protein ABUT20_06075 [Bacteroidota bacterium]